MKRDPSSRRDDLLRALTFLAGGAIFPLIGVPPLALIGMIVGVTVSAIVRGAL